MKSNDYSQLEEHFLNYIKESENKMIKHINSKNSEINEFFKKYETKINNIIVKNESISETITSQKVYMNKIAEFDTFKNKADKFIISHEYKLKTLTNDLNSLQLKYDKKISANLEVQGYIGSSCRFKTISDYLSYSISEMNKKKSDDDKKDIRDLRAKYDNIINSMVKLNDSSIDKCQEYVNKIKNNLIEFIETKLRAIDEKRLDYKTEMYKYNFNNEQKFIESKNTLKEIKKKFEEYIENYNEKMEEINNINNMMNQKIETNIKNIKNNKLEIDDLKNNIERVNDILKGIIISLKSNNIPTNNISQLQFSPKKTINAMTNTQNNLLRIMTKYGKDKEIFEKKSKSNKIFIETNKKNDSGYKSKKIIEENKIQNIQPFLQTRVIIKKENSIPKKNILRNNTDDEYISEKDNKTINKNFWSSDSSIDLSRKFRIKSNNNYLKQNNEKNTNNKTFSDSNQYPKKELVNTKSLCSIKDKNMLNTQKIISKYQTKKNNFKSPKYTFPPKNELSKSQKEKEKEKENEKEKKENPEKSLIAKKIKLNYDLINKMYNSKILDLYSFSVSPPNGQLNYYNYLTINDNSSKNSNNKATMFESEREKENGVNFKIVEMGMYMTRKSTPKTFNVKDERKKLFKMKNRERYSISNERIKIKSKELTKCIINMNQNGNIPSNKTFIEKDYDKKKKEINFDNHKLRTTMKELKRKEEEFHCLTGK